MKKLNKIIIILDNNNKYLLDLFNLKFKQLKKKKKTQKCQLKKLH